VEDGDAIVPLINAVLAKFTHTFFTRDWHPPDHVSFSDDPEFTDGSWPPHCIRQTEGAAFHEHLRIPDDSVLINKATETDEESYSGFHNTDLREKLEHRGVSRVFICGLAENICVHHTVLDGLKAGFDVVLLTDATRGIDQPPGALEQSRKEMKEAGAQFATTEQLEQ
jgi:nicotinamidase/pyrazinamidase